MRKSEEKRTMASLSITIPTLFGDHHTVAVHSILGGLDGVEKVYVSTGFRQVFVEYNSKKIKKEAVLKALADRGYSEGEFDLAFADNIEDKATRHTAAYTGVGDTISFAESQPAWKGGALWPCPGLEYRLEKALDE
jgi:copper chaperone CopZ